MSKKADNRWRISVKSTPATTIGYVEAPDAETAIAKAIRGLIGSKRRSCNVLALGLAYLASACTISPSHAPIPHTLTADEALAVQSRVTDCEWRAASQHDDGRRTISDLARQAMGICAVELLKARRAFGFSPNDPSIDSDEFEQAVNAVEGARKTRSK